MGFVFGSLMTTYERITPPVLPGQPEPPKVPFRIAVRRCGPRIACRHSSRSIARQRRGTYRPTHSHTRTSPWRVYACVYVCVCVCVRARV
jgi:hypothetical protein